jgi:hypothetical protein
VPIQRLERNSGSLGVGPSHESLCDVKFNASFGRRKPVPAPFPLWSLGLVTVVCGLCTVVVSRRTREAERLLYARLPLRTFGDALRHGWLPDPVTISVQAVMMRLGPGLSVGRAVSVVLGIAAFVTLRSIAAELGLRGSRLTTALLLTNGVLVAQAFLVDPAAQRALAAALVVMAYARRSARPGLLSYLLAAITAAGACVIEPRLLVLVGALVIADVGLAWGGGRRWETLLLTPIILGAAGCAVVVAYRTNRAGDFESASVWLWASASHALVALASVVALVLAVRIARRSPRCWVLVAWISAGLVNVGWAALRADPPVWWSIPAIWMVAVAWFDLPASSAPRVVGLSLGSLLIAVSALGWATVVRPVPDVSKLTTTLFNESRLGDQVIFLPSATRIAFEFDRPVDRLLPVPEFPDAPWGGYPSATMTPDAFPSTAAERTADTATRLWVVSDIAKPGSDLAAVDALAYLKQQIPVSDGRAGSIRVQCFELGISP